MALLEADTTVAAPAVETVVTEPVVDAGNTAVRPADALDGAAQLLFGETAPADQKPVVEETPEAKVAREAAEAEAAKTPVEETPEQKAEREAREANETPEQKAEREAKEAADAARYGAPEGDYEFTVPEGITLDPALTADVGTLSKELNLSPESAQKVIDLGVKMRQADAAALDAVHSGWEQASKTDKEFGGDKLPQSLAAAQKALKEFGTPELFELVNGAKLGDHPEVIRLFVRIAARISEAPIVNGGAPVNADAASVMYPTLARK